MLNLPERLLKSALLYTITILLGCSFVTWSFFIKPLHVKLANLETEKRDIGLKKAAIENISGQLKRISTYGKAFSSEQQLPWLIEESNRFAAESGLTLVSAAPAGDQVVDAGGYKKIALRIEAKGSYHELGRFISMVENSPRFIKVSSVNINLPVTDAESSELHIWISLCIYSWKEAR